MTAEKLERSRDRGLIAVAIVIGGLLATVAVLTTSRAAFSDTTENQSNFVNIGDVALTDNDGDVNVLFEIEDMAPGDSSTACIEVTYQGTIPDPGGVVVYSGGFTDSGSVATDINLTIEDGSGASAFGDCTGFSLSGVVFDGALSLFDSSHTDYSSGAGTWDPSSSPESRSYRITVELDTNASNSTQGGSVTDLVFTWEVQS